MAAPPARPIVVSAGGPTDAAPSDRDDASADRPASITTAEETAMTTQATSQHQQEKAGLRVHLLMTALTLTALSALALWHVRQGGDQTAAPTARSAAQRGATEGAITITGLSDQYPEDHRAWGGHRTDTLDTLDGATTAPTAVRPTPMSGLVIYFAASDDAARALRSELYQAQRDLGGVDPPLAMVVLVAGSPEAENVAGLSLPPGARVYDLRGGAGSGGSSRAAVVTTRGGMAELYAERAAPARVTSTIYIMESVERALAVRAEIDLANVLRAAWGEPPLSAEVTSFDSAEAEVFFWAAHETTGGGDGRSRTVVDLRSRPAVLCPIEEATSSAAVPDIC